MFSKLDTEIEYPIYSLITTSSETLNKHYNINFVVGRLNRSKINEK